jgi:hypothetical protein
MGPVSNRYHVYHAPSLQNKSHDQGSVSVEPKVRVPYVGTRHQGFQQEASPTFMDDDLNFTDTIFMRLDSIDADLNGPDDTTNPFNFNK